MTQEFVTLPREVVKQATRSLERYCFDVVVTKEVHAALRSALDQPQGEHDPVGEAGPMPGADGFTMACFRASDVSVGTKLYTNQQPKREPLTDEQIDAIADAMPGGLEGFLKGWGWRQFARAVLEATNNIK